MNRKDPYQVLEHELKIIEEQNPKEMNIDWRHVGDALPPGPRAMIRKLFTLPGAGSAPNVSLPIRNEAFERANSRNRCVTSMRRLPEP